VAQLGISAFARVSLCCGYESKALDIALHLSAAASMKSVFDHGLHH
jgi:hypothetical protein